MYQRQPARGSREAALNILELIYVNAARSVRQRHHNAVVAVVLAIIQNAMMVAIFVLMFSILGMRSSAIRGDFVLYIMSGVFIYFAHVRAVSAVANSEGPASPMMQHLPMTTAVAIASAALSALYVQFLSMSVILIVYDLGWGTVEIEEPAGALAMVFLAWFSGISVGMVFLAMKPWMPAVVGVLIPLYTRANMIASGKMFLANSLPGYMLVMFAWNPLFHIIDQARGFVFINYNPHNTSLMYPVYISLTLLTIGLMGEFFTRKHASASWNARR